MPRVAYPLLMVVGLALAVFSVVRLVEGAPPRPTPAVALAPTTVNRLLTPGTWELYGQAGTGPLHTALPVNVTVTAPGGQSVPVSVPAYIGTQKVGGRTYDEAVSMRIKTAGTYQVEVSPQGNLPLRIVLIRSSHSRLPWGALAIDGGVLVGAGLVLILLSARRRRQAEVAT